MAGIIKKNAKQDSDSPEVKDWQAGTAKVPISKKKRILKGDEVPVVPIFKAVPRIEGDRHGPSAEPIVENGVITGVVVTCVCGEQTTVYFDYDEPAE